MALCNILCAIFCAKVDGARPDILGKTWLSADIFHKKSTDHNSVKAVQEGHTKAISKKKKEQEICLPV